MVRFVVLPVVVLVAGFASAAVAGDHQLDLVTLTKTPAAFAGAAIANGKATLANEKWAFLRTREDHTNAELTATVTLLEPAKRLRFFGESWSVWPDANYGDGGFEAGLLLCAGKEGGYRVQLSHKYQEVTLVKYPNGGYLRSVPCPVKLKQAHQLTVTLRGNEIVVRVDGQEKIRYRDYLLPLAKGAFGVGVGGGKVVFEKVSLRPLAAATAMPKPTPHTPQFRVRQWLGGRPWVFDGDEPIMLLPTPAASGINNVKLRPGYKPQLSWNSHWDIANQGAYKAGENRNSETTTEGGGATLKARWTAQQVDGRFTTRTALTVGWDAKRQTYTYDVASELEVSLAGPFQFRYGYDFEHHTPLDPFRWQYLLVKRDDGGLYRRPVYPIDPGPLSGIAAKNGLRLWYGRHLEAMVVAPAVEYHIAETGSRKLNTAVCAAFYDTGVAFEAETAKAGTKVSVRYRYTGYPAAEAEKLFAESKLYETWMLDPRQHYIFADQWPKLTFAQFVPTSETWIYGRTPFLTGHNTRPSYELAKDTGVGSGFAMKLGPGAFARAKLPAPAPLPKGRYAVTAQVKSVNAHGPGGRIELFALDAKNGKELRRETHYVGNGSFDWKRVGFLTDLPSAAGGLAVAFGNAGTGEVLFAEVEFQRVEGPAPPGLAPKANGTAPKADTAPPGAIADYRMEEGRGLHVYNYARGPFGMLELANLDWTKDDGRPALKFADNTTQRKEYPRAGGLERNYLSHPGYKNRATLPVAVAGVHGGGFELKAFTLAAFIKPAPAMGKADHGGKGDVLGLGARRFILRLQGQKAPYRLVGAVNVNDLIGSDTKLEAERWYHVAMTGEPTETKKWRIRLYVDGKLVGEGVTQKFAGPATIPPSLILGAELFYFHDAYYRGLIGRTLVFDRALNAEQLADLATRPKKSGD